MGINSARLVREYKNKTPVISENNRCKIVENIRSVDQALSLIHISALYRMDQQQEYILQFFGAVQKKSTEDSQIVPHLFDQMQEHMVTDMGKEQYLKMAMDGLGSGLASGDFYTVSGVGMATDWYDEFHVDEAALEPLLLELFYREAG